MHEIIKQVKTNISMETLLMKTGSKIQKIRLVDLLCIRFNSNCLFFYFETTLRLTEGNFHNTLKILPGNFILINQDTIINFHFVKKVEPIKRNIILKDGSSYKFSATIIASLYKMYQLKNIEKKIKKHHQLSCLL